MDVHDRDDFGTLLRRHRLAVGLTQEELAERTRLSARGISDLERGVTTHPRKDTLHLLIDALQLTSEERETLRDATRAARMTPTPQVATGSASRNDGNGDVSATDRVPARSSQQWRALRLPAISRPRASPRVVAIAASILILVVTAAGGMFGQRLAHTSSDRSILSVPGRTFRVWGLEQPSHASSVAPLFNALRTTVDRQGNIYVTEGSGLFSPANIPTNHVDIIKLSPSGQILARWGHFGSRRGELNQPAGVVVDPHGNVYVADFGNDRIQKFSPSGKVLAVWGSFGAAPGQFDLPMGITLDSHGNIYVADYSNNRIQKLSPSGKVLAVWGHECGSQRGQFCVPTDVSVGPSDRVYVADSGNNRIQVLSPTGRSLDSWNQPYNPPNPDSPFALAVNARGDFYVTYHDASQILKYSVSGVSLGTWHVGSSTALYGLHGVAIDLTGHPIAVAQDDRLYRSSPDGRSTKPLTTAPPLTPARFDHPSILTVDRQGFVYVITGRSENRLQKLSASGRPVRKWGGRTFRLNGLYDLTGMVVDDRNNVYVSDVLSSHILKVSPSGKLLARWGREGQRPGQFETPYGLTTDHHGSIYVADTGNNRIQKLSPTGMPLGQWGQLGTEPGQFNAPRAVTVDAQGNMYVADTGNRRIQKLSSLGKALAVWGPTLPGGERFREVTSVSLDQRGNVYAADAPENQITELSPTGTVVARWGAKGVRPSQFRGPESVVVDRNNNVYVADAENNRIEKLSR